MTVDPTSLVVLASIWVSGPYRLEVIPMDASYCERTLRVLTYEDRLSECMPMSWWREVQGNKALECEGMVCLRRDGR